MKKMQCEVCVKTMVNAYTKEVTQNIGTDILSEFASNFFGWFLGLPFSIGGKR